MSLINKMLQDLEERKSGSDVVGDWQGQVRAAPQPRSRGFNWVLVLGVTSTIAAGAGGAAWWLLAQQDKQAAVVPQPIVRPAEQSIAPQLPPLSLKLDHLPPNLSEVSTGHASGSAVLNAVAEPGPAESSAPAVDGDRLSGTNKSTAAMSAPGQAASQSPRQLEQAGSKVSGNSKSIPEGASDSSRKQPASTALNSSVKPASAEKQKARAAEFTNSVDEEGLVPVKISKQLKELTPAQRAENEYQRGLTLIEQGRSKEASGALELALQMDSRHAAARQTLAALLIDGKRPDEAMRVLSEGLSIDRAQPGLAMMLARLQVDKQDVRTAIQTLQAGLLHANERADYRAFMAALLQREARHKEAIEHYLVALRKAPGNGIWWMGAGISLHAENRVPEARDAFNRAKTSGTLSPELLAFVEQKLTQLR